VLYIQDKDGNFISRSKNLRGVRAYAMRNQAQIVRLYDLVGGAGAGKLYIRFVSEDTFEAGFASFAVMCDYVRRWRSLYGAELRVNGVHCGTVRRDNEHLIQR
jgi:hypothetical protein